jgi:kinesin family protein 6/9
MASKRKITTLKLEERYEVLKLYDTGKSSRQIASELGVGRSQIQNILKRKSQVIEDYFGNGDLDRRRKLRKTGFEDVNQRTHDWYDQVVAVGKPPKGAEVQAKAVSFAKDLGITGFKGSSGWLQSFMKRARARRRH